MFRMIVLIPLLITIAISQGCVSTHKISEYHLDSDRSSYYPLAVISSDKSPEVTSDSSYESNVAGTGTKACIDLATSPDGAIAAVIACIPLMIFDVAAASVESVQDDIADNETQSKTEQMISRLKVAVGNNALQENIIEVLKNRNAPAKAISMNLIDTTDSVDDEDYALLQRNFSNKLKSLADQGYKKALLTNVVFARVKERDYLSKENFTLYCLQLRVNGTLIDTVSGDEISSHSPRIERCLSLESWRKDNTLESTVTKMQEALSTDILEELLFVHYTKTLENEEILIEPIHPKLNNEWDGYYAKDLKPATRKDYSTITLKLHFTDIDSTPTFSWKEINIPGAEDISYDFRINAGREKILQARKSHVPLSDEVIPVTRYVKESDYIYRKNDLKTTSHKPDIELNPCSWYYWSVKANYNLNGYPRSTRWSSYSGSSFPIRTSADENNPDCWDSKVDWGPIGATD